MTRALLLACLLAWMGLTGVRAQTTAADPPAQVLVLLAMPAPHFRPDGHYAGGYADAAGRAARRRIATSLARAHGLRMATDWPLPVLGLDCYVMDVPPPLRPADVAARLGGDPQVAWAQVMNVFRPLAHDDPLFGEQVAARQWQLEALHRVATGRGVRVAVIDSGVQADHPDLVEQVAARSNFVTGRGDAAELHGTAVAGIIAARADNHVGIAGIAPQARLLALRACWQAAPADTLCTSLSLARALGAAIDGDAQVVNLSLGGPSDRLVQLLVEAALARGIAVVAALDERAPGGGFPAALPGVIAVADAPQARGARGVSAPGIDVLTTLPGSRWGMVSGASYAAAHVSGLLALIIEARSRGGGRAARAPVGTDLVSRADGRIDACATLARAAPTCACTCDAAPAADPVARH